MKKEEWLKEKARLQEEFDKADAAFDANPCKKTATRLSNLRQELKKHDNAKYDGFHEEQMREFADWLAPLLRDCAEERREELIKAGKRPVARTRKIVVDF